MRYYITMKSKGRQVQKACAECGASFVSFVSQKRKYCSPQCAKAFRKRVNMHTCPQCGTRFHSNQPKPRFCSLDCSNLWHRVLPSRTCARCGREFRSRNPKPKYCSAECRIDSSRIPIAPKTCAQCGAQYLPKRHDAARSSRYCSLRCSAIYKLVHAPKKRTVIELATYQALVDMNADFAQQVRIGPYVVDALLPAEQIVIECMGDFWHCNPAVYPAGPKCQIQRNVVEKDKLRAQTLTEMGYHIALVWERAITERGARAALEDALREVRRTAIRAPSLP